VDAASLEARLAELIAQVPARAKRVGDCDLRQLLTRMAEVRHSDDEHHNGESVLEHTRCVLGDLDPLVVSFEPSRARRLRLAVLLHDLGKVPAHSWNEDKRKHTFYNHHLRSVDIARRLLAPFAEDVPGDLDRLMDLVRFHDVFYQLALARRADGGTRYLRRFAAEPVSVGQALEDLATIARADSQRARAREETQRRIDLVVTDLARYRAEEAARLREQEAISARRETNLATRRAELVTLLEAAEPGLSGLLPDLRAVKARLGERRDWAVIKDMQEILDG
jgi:hypothetical protein